MRVALAAAAVAVAATCLTGSAAAESEASSPTLAATVVGVTDPVTLRVRVRGGGRSTVRLLGVRPPPRGNCYGDAASGVLTALVLGRQVRLAADGARPLRPAARMTAYVSLPGNRDVGRLALLRGLVRLDPTRPRLARSQSYRAAEARARERRAGLWSCPAYDEPPPDPPAPPGPPAPPALDRVTADFVRRGFGGGIVRGRAQAWSGAGGESPDGHFLHQVETGSGVFEVRGRVTCLTVLGNRATLAGIVEETTVPSAPVGSAVTMIFTDNGTPGAGHDTTLTFLLAPDPSACPIGSPLEGAEEILIEDGDIVVEDR